MKTCPNIAMLHMCSLLWCLLFAAADAEYLRYKDFKQPLNVRIKYLMSRMTLEEKIGQMTQIDYALASPEIIKKYHIGSILITARGGSSPQASAEAWTDMSDSFQEGALSDRLGIPIIIGMDAVHGHNNVFNATIFHHNVGLGATRHV